MNYQFLEDFKKLSVKCPPESYQPKSMQVFRWVFEDLKDERNFKPRYFLAPKSEWKKINAIAETDGVNDEPEKDNYGHFNHHPRENHQYQTKFKIVSKL
jgi:hypothetical protein